MKKLGFGLMRLPLLDPNDGGSIDLETTKKMVDAFLSAGFTYFDTAWMYCNFKSEIAAREALVARHPRDSFTLASKLHAGYLKSREDRDRIFEEQLRKTGVSYFDYYLLHAISADMLKKYEEYDCFTWLKEKKTQGLVRHIGFSFHDSAALLDQILDAHPEMEFVQLQINYLDWDNSEIQSRLCYESARRHGLPIIVMEPVKGGTLAQVPSEVAAMFEKYRPGMSPASWAIRFAAGLEGVMMVLSGMSTPQQLADNLSYMRDFQLLDEKEREIIRRAVAILNAKPAIPCTGCSYCVDGCPREIAIPRYFSLYNADLQECRSKEWTAQQSYYESLTQTHGAAGDCIGCGRCEKVCPQHLNIRSYLKAVASHFGK